jgi:hypothetical protein
VHPETIVKHLHVFEDGSFCLFPRLESQTCYQLCFQRSEEAEIEIQAAIGSIASPTVASPHLYSQQNPIIPAMTFSLPCPVPWIHSPWSNYRKTEEKPEYVQPVQLFECEEGYVEVYKNWIEWVTASGGRWLRKTNLENARHNSGLFVNSSGVKSGCKALSTNTKEIL